MGKSVLIIKTPESCEKCQLCVNVLGKHYCAAKGTHIAKGERDCSCPLVAVPTVEAVPVVRCKDCKYSDLPAVLTRKYGKAGTLTCHNRYGSCNNRNVKENDFRSAGELPDQT